MFAFTLHGGPPDAQRRQLGVSHVRGDDQAAAGDLASHVLHGEALALRDAAHLLGDPSLARDLELGALDGAGSARRGDRGHGDSFA